MVTSKVSSMKTYFPSPL